MGDYILLLGASIKSGNRGVSALTLGTINVLGTSYGRKDIALLQISSTERVEKDTVTVGGREAAVSTYYFSKYKFLLSAAEFYMLRLFGRKPTCRLSRLILGSERVFNLNEGDSFSDIYGRKRIIRHFMDSFLVLLSGKELTFLPQTIGPFDTVTGRLLARHVLRRVRKTYIRDVEGAKFLNALGVAYSIAADMSVYMEPKQVSCEINDNMVGVNVSGLLFYQGYGRVANRFRCYGSLIHRILDMLVEKGFNVLLIPHTYTKGGPDREDDLAAIEEIVKSRERGTVRHISDSYSAPELKYLISRLQFFIGSRMHSCIAALSTSVPAVGLGYSGKFRGTFEMFKQGDCAIDICDITEDDIGGVVARVLERIERRAVMRRELEAANRSIRSLSLG